MIDSTGLRTLSEVVRQSRADGTRIVLCDLSPSVRATIAGSPLRPYRRLSDSQRRSASAAASSSNRGMKARNRTPLSRTNS